MSKPYRLGLIVQYISQAADLPPRAKIRAWVRAALEKPAEITVRLVDQDEGLALNQNYRGKDYATNVLSFPYENGDSLLGDLALCVPVVQREAQEQNKSLEAHYAHLIVHGVLHLHGYDHEADEYAAQQMETRERDILRTLSYPDPYS